MSEKTAWVLQTIALSLLQLFFIVIWNIFAVEDYNKQYWLSLLVDAIFLVCFYSGFFKNIDNLIKHVDAYMEDTDNEEEKIEDKNVK